MATKSPLTLLENELSELKESLEKSIQLYENGNLDLSTHLIHKRNLKKAITDYLETIELLKYAQTHIIEFIDNGKKKK